MRGPMQFPIVKITLQGMEHSIAHAMTEHLANMDSECQRAVNSAIKEFDYAGEVRNMTKQLIQQGIKSALERELAYGAPYEAIKKIAGEMIRNTLEEMRDKK